MRTIKIYKIICFQSTYWTFYHSLNINIYNIVYLIYLKFNIIINIIMRFNKNKICIFDTETTNIPKNVKRNNIFKHMNIIELGYIIVDNDLNILKEYNSLIKGNFKEKDISTEITGITKEDTIKNGKSFEVVIKEFIKDIKDCSIIIAHNIFFDFKMILKELKYYNKKNYINIFLSKIRLCSYLDIFKKEINKKEIKNYKLETIYNYLIKDNYIQTHRALDDVYMIYKCLLIFKENTDFSIINYFLNKKLSKKFNKYPKEVLTYRNLLEKDIKYLLYILRKFYDIKII